MNPHSLTSTTVRAAALCLLFGLSSARADMIWRWSYTGTDINATGSLVTTDSTDADGFHQILSISGNRNGDAIVGLVPTGTAIPGNEPYDVDNLIRLSGPGQLSLKGFGYELASGAYANPYYADFLSPPSHAEVFTQGGVLVSELPVVFSASPVPEPSRLALVLCGLGAAGLWRRRVLR